VSWLEGDRRRQSKQSYATKREAQETLAAMIDAHRRQDFVAPTGRTVVDVVDTWLHALETQGRRVSTLNGYRTTMNRYVLPRLGSRKLQDLRATDLDDLYAELLRAGGVGGQPLSMTTAAMTGMTRGELVALRWNAVDLARSTVDIRAAATVLRGVETIAVPKTKRSRRTIELDQRTVAVLKWHRATQREELFELGMTSPSDDRVFTNEVGDPIRPNSVGQAFARLVETSGLPVIRLHDLRHLTRRIS
jgi:integrase